MEPSRATPSGPTWLKTFVVRTDDPCLQLRNPGLTANTAPDLESSNVCAGADHPVLVGHPGMLDGTLMDDGLSGPLPV